ncbi:hypothetical protein FOL47_009543 [Perkinsus chesapeaki]|uniref:Uncharacterized protein n=1 Tax=Perkinsus chesapeaki TaxID=330153 RepID=A0A7J6L7M7_PERCH|nr:hypothetical protein FOL47_009543 [Perkinsus chesapeaki]
MSDFDVIECVRLEMARLEDDPVMIDSFMEGILTLPATLMAPISHTIKEYCRSTITGYESNSLGSLKLIKALYEHPSAAIGDVVQPRGMSGNSLLPQNKVPSLKDCLLDILEDCIVGVYHNARTPDIAQNVYLLICWWRDSQAFGDNTLLIEQAIHTMTALRRCSPANALVSESCALNSAMENILSDELSVGWPLDEIKKADSDMDALMVALEPFIRDGLSPDQTAESITAPQLEKLCQAHISVTDLLIALDARHKALTEKCQALRVQVNFVDEFLRMQSEGVSSSPIEGNSVTVHT